MGIGDNREILSLTTVLVSKEIRSLKHVASELRKRHIVSVKIIFMLTKVSIYHFFFITVSSICVSSLPKFNEVRIVLYARA